MSALSYLKNGVCFTALSFCLISPVNALALHNGHQSLGNTSSLLHTISEQDQKAEAFITKMGDKAVGFLSDKSMSSEQKRKEFQKLLKDHFDMDTLGKFALGSHWRTATPAQQREYLKLFEKLIVDVYSKRFDDYQGQRFEVKSSQPTGKQDSLVRSEIVPTSGPKVKVDWRVRNSNGTLQIIDVVIEGVSMSLTQRSDFSSVIQRGGGNVEALLEHLRK
ncbi:MAG: ABC transporter substrate-binding protein [Alphaproteobacteria bacterium]|nr:ABC transporter substrate-binding protein [Alphaproteobacteria bacterium]NCQ88617.1 ABC transporter substrate-binding protein [Alphaproteobacteria bacterium]NCT06160.1 ABC transporter substrate-binding protein [Alphaproteobacteria bacterium]